MAQTYRVEGFRALFKGNMAQVARVYPYSGIQLMSFDVISKAIAEVRHGEQNQQQPQAGQSSSITSIAGKGSSKDYHYRLTSYEKMFAGAVAGGSSVLVTYPLDLMRARLAVQRETGHGSLRYENLWQAFRRMYHSHGLANFYRGIAPTLLGILPYAAISFTTFETTKAMVEDRTGQAPTTAARLACGGLAGLAGQVSTYPLDIVRRRMQTEGFSPIHAHAVAPAAPAEAGAAASAPAAAGTAASTHAAPSVPEKIGSGGGGNGYEFHARRLSAVATAKHIVAVEGVRGLYKGFSMNVVKGPVGVGVSFTTYDALKRLLLIER